MNLIGNFKPKATLFYRFVRVNIKFFKQTYFLNKTTEPPNTLIFFKILLKAVNHGLWVTLLTRYSRFYQR